MNACPAAPVFIYGLLIKGTFDLDQPASLDLK